MMASVCSAAVLSAVLLYPLQCYCPDMAATSSSLSYRQEQAAATRERIAAAARRLFAAQGYRMTTMTAIADEAGVAHRTVYTAFGAKREIQIGRASRRRREALA